MFARKIINEVKGELRKINFKVDELFVLKIEEDKCLLNALEGDRSYIVHYYEGGCSNIVNRYDEFTKYGIKLVEHVASTDKIIIYLDIDCCEEYRRITKDDLRDERIVISIAKLMKNVHRINDLLLVNYSEYFSLNNLIYIMEKFNLKKDPCLCYIYDNFSNIKLKLDRLDKGAIIDELEFENLVVSKENHEVLLSNVVNVKSAYLYKDVADFLKYIDKGFHEVFIKSSGNFSDIDKVIDYVVSTIVELYLYAINESKCTYINDYIKRISSGELLKFSKSLVEWL